jgi:DNA-binding transcriptional MocR family regulator
MFQALHCEMVGMCSLLHWTIWSAHFPNLSEVETDAEGISSQSLRTILNNWPAGKAKPKVLYTVPVCVYTPSIAI